MARADPDFEPATAQVVDAGELARQVDRMVEVIVQNEWANPQTRGALGHRQEW